MNLSAAPSSLDWEPTRPFAYIGGNVALDLINTVDWTERGSRADRLTSYRRLLEWATGSGVLSSTELARCLRASQARPADADRAVAQARAVRHLLAGVVRGLVGAPSLSYVATAASALDEFNTLLAESHRFRVLVPERTPASPTKRPRVNREPAARLIVRWPWQDPTVGGRDRLPLESLVWPVIQQGATLLTSSEASSVRMCEGSDCGWVFVDRSRGGRRRWCAMETCGTLAKEARRRPRGRSVTRPLAEL